MLKHNGPGLGVDAGVTFFLSKYLEVVASVLDLGAITYKKNTSTYQKAGSARYDGFAIDRLFGDNTFLNP